MPADAHPASPPRAPERRSALRGLDACPHPVGGFGRARLAESSWCVRATRQCGGSGGPAALGRPWGHYPRVTHGGKEGFLPLTKIR